MAFGRVNEVEQMFLILHGILVLPLNDSPRKGVRGGGSRPGGLPQMQSQLPQSNLNP